MKIYDITQELFSSCVFPGDPKPSCSRIQQIQNGDSCNLTVFEMCAHNGTHVDAPLHFYENGRSVDALALEKVIGPALVLEVHGEMTAEQAGRIMETYAPKRLLLKGEAVLNPEAARAMTRRGLWLVGVESQTVGTEDAPEETHLELLKTETVILEGIRLEGVPEGWYFLYSAPLKLGKADGAPCRAVLLDWEAMADGLAKVRSHGGHGEGK